MLQIHAAGVVNVGVNFPDIVKVAMFALSSVYAHQDTINESSPTDGEYSIVRTINEDTPIWTGKKHTLVWAVSSSSLRRVYIDHLLDKYLSLRYA